MRRGRTDRAPGPESPRESSALRSGAISTAVAQLHLRTILAYLDMPTLGQPEAYIQVKEGFFDEAGNFANPDTRKFLHGWMDKYVAWVKRLTGQLSNCPNRVVMRAPGRRRSWHKARVATANSHTR